VKFHYNLWKSLFKLLFCVVVLGTLFYHVVLIDIPNVGILKTLNPSRSSYMNDDPLIKNNKYKTISYVKLSEVSPSVIQAVLSAEDDTFFRHNGFNWSELFKSFKINLKKKKFARGGSTITQQLARNLFLSKDKSLFRKIRESLIAFKLERTLSKERILELYLNYAEFGPGIYGITQGSQYHFNKNPIALSRQQSALLAAVLPNPKYYGKKPYPSKTYNRQQIILNRMAHYNLFLPKSIANRIIYKPNQNLDENDHESANQKNGEFELDDEFKEFDDDFDSGVFVDE